MREHLLFLGRKFTPDLSTFSSGERIGQIDELRQGERDEKICTIGHRGVILINRFLILKTMRSSFPCFEKQCLRETLLLISKSTTDDLSSFRVAASE